MKKSLFYFLIILFLVISCQRHEVIKTHGIAYLENREKLSEANLKGANLSGASLKGAQLSAADLRWTHLAGADFEGAELLETKLKGTDLSGSLNIDPEELATAILDEKTKIPDYLEVIWTSEDTFECKAKN